MSQDFRLLSISAATNYGITDTEVKLVSTSGLSISFSSVTVDTVDATTYLNLPINVFVTGGTYNPVNSIATYTNNTGGTFKVSGFNSSSAVTDTYVTGVTINNGTLSLTRNNNLSTLTASTVTTRELLFNSIVWS